MMMNPGTTVQHDPLPWTAQHWRAPGTCVAFWLVAFHCKTGWIGGAGSPHQAATKSTPTRP